MVGTVKKLGPSLVGTVKEEDKSLSSLCLSPCSCFLDSLSLSLWQANPFVRVTEFVLLVYAILPSLCTLCIVFTLVSFCCLLKLNSLLSVSEPQKSICSSDNIEIGHGLFLKIFAERVLGCFDLCFLQWCFACWISEHLLSRF